MLYAALVIVLVALDQLVKYLVLTHIPLGGHMDFLPHVLELTYVKNTGAAFSILNQHTWPWPPSFRTTPWPEYTRRWPWGT